MLDTATDYARSASYPGAEAADRDAGQALWTADIINAGDPKPLPSYRIALAPAQPASVGRGDEPFEQAGGLDGCCRCIEPGG